MVFARSCSCCIVLYSTYLWKLLIVCVTECSLHRCLVVIGLLRRASQNYTLRVLLHLLRRGSFGVVFKGVSTPSQEVLGPLGTHSGIRFCMLLLPLRGHSSMLQRHRNEDSLGAVGGGSPVWFLVLFCLVLV